VPQKQHHFVPRQKSTTLERRCPRWHFAVVGADVLRGYSGAMAAQPVMTAEEWFEAVRHAGRPTADDVTILWDGRRLDSREAVMEWLAEVEAKRASRRRRGRRNLTDLHPIFPVSHCLEGSPQGWTSRVNNVILSSWAGQRSSWSRCGRDE
jgi:hypothetical protein